MAEEGLVSEIEISLDHGGLADKERLALYSPPMNARLFLTPPPSITSIYFNFSINFARCNSYQQDENLYFIFTQFSFSKN